MKKHYTAMNPKLENIYLDWVNNYLTIEKFSENYSMNMKDAQELVAILQRNHLHNTYEKGQA